MAGVNKEIWTGEVVRGFARTGTFLDAIPSADQYVNNDVIHLTSIGVKPDVLINNTTYPIPTQAIGDADVPITLDKFQTKATPVTDDELYAISYDRMATVVDLHRESLTESQADKAIHALAPSADAASTPVLESAAVGQLAIADIVALKKAFDDAKVPQKGRVLVLCTEHVHDLLLESESFKMQYMNVQEGKLLKLFGFEIHEYSENPHYDTNGDKKAFGASIIGTDRRASVAFYAPRTFKARGSMKMYHSEASTDPQSQQNLVNFRNYFIAMPKVNEAIGALIYKAS